MRKIPWGLIIGIILFSHPIISAGEYQPMSALTDTDRAVIKHHTRMRAPIEEILKDATQFKILAPQSIVIKFKNNRQEVYGVGKPMPYNQLPLHDSSSPVQENAARLLSQENSLKSFLAEKISDLVENYNYYNKANILLADTAAEEYFAYVAQDHSLMPREDAGIFGRRGNRYRAQFEALNIENLEVQYVFWTEYFFPTPFRTLTDDIPSEADKMYAVEKIRDIVLQSNEDRKMMSGIAQEIKGFAPHIFLELFRKGVVMSNFD